MTPPTAPALCARCHLPVLPWTVSHPCSVCVARAMCAGVRAQGPTSRYTKVSQHARGILLDYGPVCPERLRSHAITLRNSSGGDGACFPYLAYVVAPEVMLALTNEGAYRYIRGKVQRNPLAAVQAAFERLDEDEGLRHALVFTEAEAGSAALVEILDASLFAGTL